MKRVGKVSYDLEFLTELATVHPIFHVSLLKKCVGDLASIVLLESVAVKDSIFYQEILVEIIDHHFERVRNKEVASVMVL